MRDPASARWDGSMDVTDSPQDRKPATADLVLVPEREGFDRYLEDTIVVDWQTSTVLEQARSRVDGIDDESLRISALFEFVRDEISHSIDAGSDVVTCNASHVLRERTGLCYAKCHLLVALLRSRGIPAGFGYQRLRDDEAQRGFSLHGFVAAWSHPRERWIVLDPRGDKQGITTRADFEAPSFAFEVDPEIGEATYPWIYARPAKRVVDLLDSSESLARIRRHLPDSLQT